MPDALDEDIILLEKSIFEAGAISKMLENNLSLEDIAKKVTQDVKIRVIERKNTPKYECNCSRERMQEAFMTIGKEEIEKIIREDGKAEIVCHFCNKKYNFNKKELEEMI